MLCGVGFFDELIAFRLRRDLLENDLLGHYSSRPNESFELKPKG
ncbi:MAG: hypothetical protein JWO71_2445 [Candidatus Acidoferrum typicum]|nr:hypothetical protein [Candidatus Acidoferrum typicum]